MVNVLTKKSVFAGFITVRTGSKRLPNKWDLRIHDRRMIEHVIDRAKEAKQLDIVVLCTSTDPNDDVLEDIAKENGIACFRGSLEDKLVRWRDAAKKFGVDYIVTIDGDDPLFSFEIVDSTVEQMKNDPCDFLQIPKESVCGAIEFCFAVKALNKVCDIKDTSDTEMMWVYFTDTGLFNLKEIIVQDKIFYIPGIRLTLDYQEDFDFFVRVFKEMDMKKNNIPLRNILKMLKEKPEVAKINYFRQNEFLANQKSKTTLVLKKNI